MQTPPHLHPSTPWNLPSQTVLHKRNRDPVSSEGEVKRVVSHVMHVLLETESVAEQNKWNLSPHTRAVIEDSTTGVE